MKLAIMQPYFFPYIGYFQAIKAVDEYILYDNLNFGKGVSMYRNKYLTNAGHICFFNVPIKEKSSFKKIADVELIENNIWRKKMLKDFYMNYKRAKYFDNIYPILEHVINFPTNKLAILNCESIKSICDYLKIDTKIITDVSNFNDLEAKLLYDNPNEELFPNLKLSNWEKKVIRILEICRLKKSETYINAIGGINLYSKTDFKDNAIDLKFVQTLDISYKQFGQQFVPNMSIIDVLMFNSVDEVNLLLDKYNLI